MTFKQALTFNDLDGEWPPNFISYYKNNFKKTLKKVIKII